MNQEEIQRRISSLYKERKKLLLKHQNDGSNFTYNIGYQLGFILGKIVILEEILESSEFSESQKSPIQ